MKASLPTKKTKKKKKSLSPAEKAQRAEQRAHERAGRYTFQTLGFKRLNSAMNVEFTYDGVKSDFDDVYVLDNVVVLCEYTISKEEYISAHLKSKKILYDKINDDHPKFINFLRTNFPGIAADLSNPLFKDFHYRVRILYCSKNTVKPALKAIVPNIVYFDFDRVQYFKSIVSTIKLSARHEFLNFIEIDFDEFGLRIVKPATGTGDRFAGSLLPEAQSGFPPGFQVVSFYADAEALLSHHYVLRKDGWRDGMMLYQRMISKTKIEGMRSHLTSKGHVFVNNIIATLPADTEIKNTSGQNVTAMAVGKVEAVTVELPHKYNCLGLVDGQHRVLSYYEGGSLEDKIKPLRQVQNLLVTGLVYPPGLSDPEKIRFEAGLFLEINSNQATAKPELKQAIALLLTPFAAESIAREVVNRLNAISSSVGGEFERFFYEKDKLKIASIVSFGVRPLVKLSGDDSAFAAWTHLEKSKLKEGKDLNLRQEYVDFATSLLDITLSAIRSRVPPDLWTRSRKVQGRLLTTTTINGATALLRLLIANGHTISFDNLSKKLTGLEKFNFHAYKSSQYNRLGRDLYDSYFK